MSDKGLPENISAVVFMIDPAQVPAFPLLLVVYLPVHNFLAPMIDITPGRRSLLDRVEVRTRALAQSNTFLGYALGRSRATLRRLLRRR